MRERLRVAVGGVLVIGLTAACGGHESRTNASAGDVNTTATPAAGVPATSAAPAPAPVESVPAKHHSKVGGALVGAAVGHVLGGHAVAGAAAGAMVQHERNKH